MTNETWAKRWYTETGRSGKQVSYLATGHAEYKLPSELIDRIVADHAATTELADARKALREINEAFIEDAAADSGLEIALAGKHIDEAVVSVRAFFAKYPDAGGEG